MQTTLSKLLLFKLSRRLHRLPKTSIGGRCAPGISFSTSSRSGRPVRGERGSDDRSEELFLRGISFRDDGREEKQRSYQEASFERPSSRPAFHGGKERRKVPPLAEEDGIDATSGDLFPDFDLSEDELGLTGSGLRGRSPSRARRRAPPREDFSRSTQSAFKDFGRDFMGDFENQRYRSPLGSASGDRIEDSSDGLPNVSSGSENLSDDHRGSDRVGDPLAQKFNLGGSGQHKTDDGNQKTLDSTISITLETAPEDADEIFKKMKESGLIPNAVAMLDGLCKVGLVQEAMKLFRFMREKRTMPDVVIYTAVVEGFCKAAKFDDAKKIFRKMQNNGITPNTFSYKVLIQGLCQGKKLEDSVEFCTEMLGNGHQPSAATLIGLVDEFIKEKRMEEADNFVKKLLERGLFLDDKAIREHLNKKGPFSPLIWEVFFGEKASRGPF